MALVDKTVILGEKETATVTKRKHTQTKIKFKGITPNFKKEITKNGSDTPKNIKNISFKITLLLIVIIRF